MRRREGRSGEPAKPIDREYSQPTETGHAADALRDSAGELVHGEDPAAVGRRQCESKAERWCVKARETIESEGRRNRSGEPSGKACREYLQTSETGHAADDLRDSANQLVAVEIPAAVVRTRCESEMIVRGG